jgi:hypothetical protein
MSNTQIIPCIELPDLPPMNITLPFGVQLNAVADFSKGPPSNCTLIQSLMVQLSPALAGMACIFKMLKVFLELSKITNPLNVPSGIVNVAKAATELAECFLFPAQIVCMIVGILKMIISFLLCIIEAVESLLNFRLGIDFSLTAGNPTLLATLTCAQNNADASSAQLRQALLLIEPLLIAIQPILSMAPSVPGPINDVIKAIPNAIASIRAALDGGSVSVAVPGAEGPLQVLQTIRADLSEFQAALAAIPC